MARFGHTPSRKATLLWLVLRYGFIDKSILVVTEGLGPQRFHGRVVILVNEHTASAGEMLAAFAEENNLATIVGVKTAGRLLSGSTFRAGEAYIVGLPGGCVPNLGGEADRGEGRIADRSGGVVTGTALGERRSADAKSIRGCRGDVTIVQGRGGLTLAELWHLASI